jgi:hypothetical protein
VQKNINELFRRKTREEAGILCGDLAAATATEGNQLERHENKRTFVQTGTSAVHADWVHIN